jgi:hypothetical protein
MPKPKKVPAHKYSPHNPRGAGRRPYPEELKLKTFSARLPRPTIAKLKAHAAHLTTIRADGKKVSQASLIVELVNELPDPPTLREAKRKPTA